MLLASHRGIILHSKDESTAAAERPSTIGAASGLALEATPRHTLKCWSRFAIGFVVHAEPIRAGGIGSVDDESPRPACRPGSPAVALSAVPRQ